MPRNRTKRKETLYKLPLILSPQPEDGYTVTCPLLPELVTEGDTAEEALANVSDALSALLEAYRDLKRPIPPILKQSVPCARQ
jgi:antitoxin HicB